MTAHDPKDGWSTLTSDPAWPGIPVAAEPIIEQSIRDYVKAEAPFYSGAMEPYVPFLAKYIAEQLKKANAASV